MCESVATQQLTNGSFGVRIFFFLKIMREKEMSTEDPVAMQHGATGNNGGTDDGRVKWSNMTPGTKKASAAQRIGIGRQR